jgi:glycosyltransferase involved in cell wall biosynthesis
VFKGKKITFIPLPIGLDDVDLTKQYQKTNDILITSRFNSTKRIDDLVYIANKINNKFVLASLLEGLLAYKLKNNPFFKELITQGKIILLGGFKYSELEKVYKPYKYLLELMDFREYKGGGVLYTILEAMKYKVIPILMKGYEPWIQEGKNYIALNKIDELPEKLNMLTKEQEEEIINNNLLFLTKNHEANKVILKYKAFYEA